MDWLRAILDGFMMSVYFNLATALWWLQDPMSFADCYPKPIKKLIKMPENVKKGKILFCLLVILPAGVYGIISAWNSGITGFGNLFWMGYIEWMLVNFGDFFGLDIYLRKRAGEKLELPGTEGNIYYSDKYWMKSLGIPEHWLAWPLIICPLSAAASAGIGLLIRMLFA